MSVDAVSSDSHSLDYAMRVTLEDGTVHKCTRVTFVGVTANILGDALSSVTGSKLPFKASRESAAATATETGINDFLDYSIRISLLCKDLTKSLITIMSDILIDIFRVDVTAVAESNTHLLLEEVAVICRSFFSCLSTIVLRSHETLYVTALQEVLANDLSNILRSYAIIHNTFRIDYNDRTLGAKAEASCLNYFYFFFKSLSRNLLFKLLENLRGV